jgi:hypothetical protein
VYFHPLDFQYPPSVPAGLSNSLQCCLPSGLVGFVIKYTHLSSLQSGSALAFVVLLFLLSNNEAIKVAFTRGVVGGVVEVVGHHEVVGGGRRRGGGESGGSGGGHFGQPRHCGQCKRSRTTNRRVGAGTRA